MLGMRNRRVIWGIAVVSLMIFMLTTLPGTSGGGRGEGKRCVKRDVREEFAYNCRREGSECRGSCTQKRWFERHCIDGDEKCEQRTRDVAVRVYRLPCVTVRNDPTCPCSENGELIGIEGWRTVPWCD